MARRAYFLRGERILHRGSSGCRSYQKAIGGEFPARSRVADLSDLLDGSGVSCSGSCPDCSVHRKVLGDGFAAIVGYLHRGHFSGSAVLHRPLLPFGQLVARLRDLLLCHMRFGHVATACGVSGGFGDRTGWRCSSTGAAWVGCPISLGVSGRNFISVFSALQFFAPGRNETLAPR